jgi:hypothetical protein
MSEVGIVKKNLHSLRERAAKAREGAERASTTQERQHFEGMARYWEAVLDEQHPEEATAGGHLRD